MPIYDRVQSLIKERGLSVKQLERECDLANATIRRWATQTPNIESVRKVAQTLNVSIDYLVNGNSPNATELPACDGIPLSQMEADLVAMFRILDDRGREDVFDFVTMKYEKASGEKESIYSTYFDESGDEESGPTEGREARDGTA